jgi:hypothetical protein
LLETSRAGHGNENPGAIDGRVEGFEIVFILRILF